ncbi:methyltransferase [Pseudomonas aeruginosa]|nr:methyltransferase [Pseudomonas aeruginosa]
MSASLVGSEMCIRDSANGRRRLTTNQGPKVFVLRAAQRWWHVKGEECERTHSRTRHRQR